MKLKNRAPLKKGRKLVFEEFDKLTVKAITEKYSNQAITRF